MFSVRVEPEKTHPPLPNNISQEAHVTPGLAIVTSLMSSGLIFARTQSWTFPFADLLPFPTCTDFSVITPHDHRQSLFVALLISIL